MRTAEHEERGWLDIMKGGQSAGYIEAVCGVVEKLFIGKMKNALQLPCKAF